MNTVASWKYAQLQKYAHSHFSLKVIAKGHLLLESMPTVVACVAMKSVVYVWASSLSGRNQGAFQSDHVRLVLRDTSTQDTSE